MKSFSNRFLRNPTELKSIKNISLLRQQAPQSSSSNQNTLKQEQQVDNQQHQQHGLNSLNSSANTQNQQPLHLHQLPSLTLHQQQQLLHQNPPPSPRVLALNGAFHQLSTSSSPTMVQHQQNGSSQHPITHFKMEPNMDTDELPTDLSVSGNSKRNTYNVKSECYP